MEGIFGVFRMAKDAAAEGKDDGAMPFDEHGKRLLIALGRESVNEFTIALLLDAVTGDQGAEIAQGGIEGGVRHGGSPGKAWLPYNVRPGEKLQRILGIVKGHGAFKVVRFDA